MSKPWDNEPTPTTDSRNHRYGIVSYEYTQNLERRLRHAERLLERFSKGEVSISAIETLHNDNVRHLEAARQEDAR